MASLTSLIQTSFSYLHFYLLSVLPHVLGMAMYAILPRTLYIRLLFLISSLHQLLNLAFGRLLPTLSCPDVDLTGKTAIVTGGNSGIGYQLALSLAKLNCAVLLAVRSESRGRDAVHSMLESVPEAKGRIKFLLLDTSSLSSVRDFASKWEGQGGGHIDILCHNAGISHPADAITTEGIETVYATNFLGSFLLTHLLEHHLSPSARVILTSSSAQLNAQFAPSFSTQPVHGTLEPGLHTPISTLPLLGWHMWSPASGPKYAQTKGMQCALARLLQRRWDLEDNERVDNEGRLIGRKTVHAFTPGFTMTPIFDKLAMGSKSFVRDLIKDPVFTLLTVTTFAATHVSQGAMTGLWLASAPEDEIAQAAALASRHELGGGGGYWDRMHREVSVADVMSDETLNRLWARWEADAGIEWK